MYNEEGDVTEIYFILKGEWAIAFNCYSKLSDDGFAEELNNEEEIRGPEDMQKQGYIIAQRRAVAGYIGDYYVLSSKRSRFHYCALSPIETFALTKSFLYNKLFVKFPGL